MNERTIRYRRAFFVRHESHRRLILRIGVILLILAAVSSVTFYFLAQQELSAEFFRAHSQVKTTMEMLLPWILSVGLLGIAIALILTAAYTRKIAGPVLRVRNELIKLADGDLSGRVTFRQGDELKELGARLNDYTSFIACQFKEIDELVSKLRDLTTQLETLSKNTASDEYKSLLEKIKITLTDLETLQSRVSL